MMAESIRVLCVEPAVGECASLEAIFTRTAASGSDVIWKLYESPSVAAAVRLVGEGVFSIILCDAQTITGSWKELLEAMRPMPAPPLLIVTSRLADEQLWAEALNLGAHDVLAKPYDSREVIWALDAAWEHWQQSLRLPLTSEVFPVAIAS